MFFVSRQRVYPQKFLAIEITTNGKKAAGEDILPFNFDGEGKNLIDPRDAVRVAARIYKQWVANRHPDENIFLILKQDKPIILEFSAKSIKYAENWAEKMYNSLPKCGSCNRIVKIKKSCSMKVLDGYYCSEYCASNKYRQIYGKELDVKLLEKEE